MEERSVEVDHVVVASPSLAQVDHPVAAKVAHHAPDCPLCQVQISGDFLHRRVRTDGHVKENPSLRREKRPIAPLAVAVGRTPAGFPVFSGGWLAQCLVSSHDSSA